MSACLLQANGGANAAEARDVPDVAAALDQACQLPEKEIHMPDGATASEAELLQAQAAVRAYDAAITTYTRCLADAEARLVALHPESATALGTMRADRNNAAIALAERMVASFNETLQKHREIGLVPPIWRNRSSARELEFCYPLRIRRTRVTVVLSISETGEVTDIGFPPALSEDLEAAIRCMVGKMSFEPARRHGIPESNIATMPFELGLTEEDVAKPLVTPVLKSQQEDIAAAYDKCLPAELREGGKVRLALTISSTGKVIEVQTAVSSGSKDVDQVAECVARTLRYKSLRYRGERIQVSMVPLTVRVTPRSQDRPVATDIE